MNRKQIHKIRYRLLDEYPDQVAPRVRAAMEILKQFRFRELEELVPVPDARLRGVICEFKRSGEVAVVDSSGPTYLYKYIPKQKKRTFLDIIWHLARSNRHFTTDEMTRLSNAKRDTVFEYLYCLRDLGYIRQVKRSQWLLVKDPGPATPTNYSKCEKLKRLRREKKKALKNGGRK